LEAVGFHRSDFRIRGEDLEFSLRVTARYKGIFVPRVCVAHLKPAADASGAEYIKQAAHLQNVFYIALHLTHGRRIASKLPGSFFRFLMTWRRTPGTIFRAGRAFWRGAILAQPAGTDTWESRLLPQTIVDKPRRIQSIVTVSLAI
jgi:GT2 family glycosyltransferase